MCRQLQPYKNDTNELYDQASLRYDGYQGNALINFNATATQNNQSMPMCSTWDAKRA